MPKSLYIGNIVGRPVSSVRVFPYSEFLSKFRGGYVVYEPLLDAEAFVATDSEVGAAIELAVRDRLDDRSLRAYLTPFIAAAFPPEELLQALERAHRAAVAQAQDEGADELRSTIRSVLDL